MDTHAAESRGIEYLNEASKASLRITLAYKCFIVNLLFLRDKKTAIGLVMAAVRRDLRYSHSHMAFMPMPKASLVRELVTVTMSFPSPISLE